MTRVNIRQMHTPGVLAPHRLWFLTGWSCPEEPWERRDIRVFRRCTPMFCYCSWLLTPTPREELSGKPEEPKRSFLRFCRNNLVSGGGHPHQSPPCIRNTRAHPQLAALRALSSGAVYIPGNWYPGRRETFYGSGPTTSYHGNPWRPRHNSPRRLLPWRKVVSSVPGCTPGSWRWSSCPEDCLEASPEMANSKPPMLFRDGNHPAPGKVPSKHRLRHTICPRLQASP